MKIFQIKILAFFLFILLLSACGDSEKQKKSDTETADSISTKTHTTFLFLTEWFDKVGVYKYDLIKQKYSPVWWHPRENVVMLIYKPGNLASYFLTSEKIGTRGNFPAFSRLKLFIISNDLSETKQIDDIGSGLQFLAQWNDDDNLEVIYTEVDKTIASYVNQYTRVYDHYGKLIDSEIKTFDIVKSGFPELVPPRNPTVSPSGKYGITIDDDSLYLKSAGIDSLRFISTIEHSLNKLKWSDDENYLFISTITIDDETVKTKSAETSKLFIYSISADSLFGVFGGSGLKNFFQLNDLLIFDDGIGNNSVIQIFSLKQQKIVDVIKTGKVIGLIKLQ